MYKRLPPDLIRDSIRTEISDSQVPIGKPTEPRCFWTCETFGRLWNCRVAKYGDPLVLGTARGPQRRPVESVERQ